MKLDQILNRVHHSDCIAFMKTLPDNCIDSIVTDPPYELGFMGKSWDNTGIANSVEMRAECLRILKTGGHLLSFSGTRTYHRMACAIEDAGFEVRDMIEWVYGSGFPKSLNIGKAVDKLQGNEREELNERGGAIQKGSTNWQGQDRSDGKGSGFKEKFIDTKGTSEWEGWGTALKPAHEPICMARKPLAEKTVAENCLKYGTGGINIDESRVLYNGDSPAELYGESYMKSGHGKAQNELQGMSGTERNGVYVNATGRFPANLIHDNSEEVRECFPEQKSGAVKQFTNNGANQPINLGGGMLKPTEGSSGNASRFFKSIIYQAKASKSERNKGCEELEEKVSGSLNFRNPSASGRSEDAPSVNAMGGLTQPKANNHPTVKPIALMEYLIKMVTREGGIVFDPFTGSGTTLVAAKKNGYQYLGTEMTEEYIPIIEARLNATEFTPKEEEIIDKGRFG